MSKNTARLDSVLTGLAMFEAYTKQDVALLRAMTSTTAPEDAIEALLNLTDVMSAVCADNLGTDVPRVIDSIRRKAVQEMSRNDDA